MRLSTETLPRGCTLLRLHDDGTEGYTQFTIVKPLNSSECELTGFVGVPDRHQLKMLFSECKKLGYKFCHIERRKNNVRSRRIFKL